MDSTFDDFDDYNGYNKIGERRMPSTFRSADFHVLGKVEYVQVSGDSVSTSASQTYHKLLTIRVSSRFMPDTLQFSDGLQLLVLPIREEWLWALRSSSI